MAVTKLSLTFNCQATTCPKVGGKEALDRLLARELESRQTRDHLLHVLDSEVLPSLDSSLETLATDVPEAFLRDLPREIIEFDSVDEKQLTFRENRSEQLKSNGVATHNARLYCSIPVMLVAAFAFAYFGGQRLNASINASVNNVVTAVIEQLINVAAEKDRTIKLQERIIKMLSARPRPSFLESDDRSLDVAAYATLARTTVLCFAGGPVSDARPCKGEAWPDVVIVTSIRPEGVPIYREPQSFAPQLGILYPGDYVVLGAESKPINLDWFEGRVFSSRRLFDA